VFISVNPYQQDNKTMTFLIRPQRIEMYNNSHIALYCHLNMSYTITWNNQTRVNIFVGTFVV